MPGQNGEEDEEAVEAMRVEMEKVAEQIVQAFEEEMEPIMDGLTKAKDTFQDLDDLLDEQHGFGLEHGVWTRSGWQEMEKLRKKLEDLKELRELVRSLGRSGGKGPKRKAPAQVNSLASYKAEKVICV